MKPVTLARRFFFIGLIILSGYLFLELSALALYRVINAESLPFHKIQSERTSIIEGFPQDEAFGGGTLDWGHAFEVIHPYLGFVRDPDKTPFYGRHGFYGQNPLGQSGSDGDLTVAIFGGSFAEGMVRNAADTLIEKLCESESFPKNRVRVLALAMGGYKQPQQLMTLTYFLALGVRFDLVINIDGFNELVLPWRENLPKNVFPAYPRAWFKRVRGLSDPQVMLMVGRIAILRERRIQWAKTFSHSPWKQSPIANSIWRLLDGRLDRKIFQVNSEIQEYQIEREGGDSYIFTGPDYHPGSREEFAGYLVEIWENCSRQMDRICRANGIEYYHFLQPNQYFPGSKPMSAAERRIAVKRKHPYRKPVERGYPLLIEAGFRLRREKINFQDLTMLFQDNDEILYADDACHLNARGYRLVAEEIGRFILAREEEQSD
ncbi:MAG: hypothetical protein P9M08_04930 [Candidatus Erginobacter occultus]|nr:hypothetical protein [Candidatus Erginobacter occultus]